jgi:hypothetical protein
MAITDERPRGGRRSPWTRGQHGPLPPGAAAPGAGAGVLDAQPVEYQRRLIILEPPEPTAEG